MKNLFTVFLMAISIAGLSQSLTLTSPSGLSEPYEVASGTIVTVEWSYFDEDASGIYTHDQNPGSNLNTDYQFSTDPAWTTISGGVDNGDGTFSYSITITEDTWIFGMYSVFFGNSFSNVINISIASDVVLEDEDGLICGDGGIETLSLQGSYTDITWYMDSVLIADESGSSIDATEAGSYYAIADGTQSNIIVVEELSIAFTGELSIDVTEITFTADAGMDSYQWYSGPDAANMTAISGATNAEYTATISSDIVYYHVEAYSDLCLVVSTDRPVSTAIFTPLVLSVNADTNSFNNVCSGTTIVLSIEEDAINYTWYANGNSLLNNQTYYNISSLWYEGTYYVESNPSEWPEITVQSNTQEISYFDMISPIIIGEDNNSLHCLGDEIGIVLADEGYDYTWYAHEEYTYNDSDIVESVNNSLSFTFENAIRITVVGSYQGCEESSTLNLNDYADQSMYVYASNYDQQYLCEDSTAYIALPSYSASNFTDFQWHEKDGDDWIEIDGENEAVYGATSPGLYKLTAISANCASAEIESNEYLIEDYTERPLNLYSDKVEMCLGDTATLNMYSNSWSNIQWLEGNIEIGDAGYELIYVPIIGAGSANNQEVYDFNHYVVKAKHNSCPNGLKITSNPIVIKPSVNPDVTVNLDDFSYRIALWDSSIFYLDCIGNDVTLSIEDEYDTYQWYQELYAGIDDYVIGDSIDGAIFPSLDVEIDVQWITAEVSLDGCIGYTDPILLDGWAFLDPAVQSYDNNMICDGDSVLVNLAFPGDWIEYFWLHDGDTVPNSNNDSIWVTEPGEYVIFAYPEQCPTALFTSGEGPTLYDFEALILEDEDEFGNPFFYAWPWQGSFEFQWFIDGVAYDNPSDIPAVLWQDEDLPAGEITVEIINNGDLCTDLSDPVYWDGNITGINEEEGFEFTVYPNPSSGEFTIKGLDPNNVESVMLYSTQGRAVRSIEINANMQLINISDLPNGMYLLHIKDKEGNIEAKTINKL